MTLRKTVTVVVIAPLVILFLMFAVANRQIVTVSMDPFDSVQPAFAMTMPLFLLIFVLVILGILIGGTAAWLRQSKWRASARRLDAEVRRLNAELAAQRARPVSPMATADTPLTLPPPL